MSSAMRAPSILYLGAGSVDLEDFLRTVMRLVKTHLAREVGEFRLYPLHLLCAYLISELQSLDEELARKALCLVEMHVDEVSDKYYESLYTYMNILSRHDLYLYVANLLHP
jgi:hypothetical protein